MKRQEIANTIKDQIGPAVLMELGAHDFVVCEQGLEFVTGSKEKFRISLRNDMYDITLMFFEPSLGWIGCEEVNEIFFFQLPEILISLDAKEWQEAPRSCRVAKIGLE